MIARVLRVLVVVLASSCAHTHTIGLFVHSVRIADGELVVERCMLQQISNKVTVTGCTTEQYALPKPAGPVSDNPSK